MYNDTTLKVWDVLSGKCIMAVTDYSTSVTHLSFLPSGNRVVSTTDSGSICVHSIKSNERKILQQSDVNKLGSIAISPDGKVLLSGATDTKASIWNLDSGVVMRVLDPKHRVGHRGQIWATTYSKDGKMVASGDNTANKSSGLKLWQASDGKLIRIFKSGTVSHLSFSPDGRMLVSCWTGSEDVKVFDTHSGKLILKLPNHKDGATGCEFSSDGRYLLTAAEDADTRLWDVATGKCIQTYSDTVRPREGLSFSGAYTIAISRNDSMIMGTHAGSIDIWDTRSGLLIRKLTDSVNGRSSMFEVRKILSSNDSKTIFTISLDLKGIWFRVWEAASGKLVRKFEMSGFDGGADLSPDNRYIATGCGDGLIRIWDLSTGKEVYKFSEYCDRSWGVSWSPDGKYILCGTLEGTVIMWKVPHLVY
jgi:WD40 repeat protein